MLDSQCIAEAAGGGGGEKSAVLSQLFLMSFFVCLTGPGEQGTAIILNAEEEKEKDKIYRVNGFNGFASDKMSLNRALKDIRHPE